MFEESIKYLHISNPDFYLYFVIYHTIAVIIFIIGMILKISIWTSGTEGGISGLLNSFIKAMRADGKLILKIFVLEAILQRRLFRISRLRWFAHFSIFISIIALTILTTLGFIVLHLKPMEFFISGWGKRWIIDFANEFFGFLLLLGLLIAAIRRIVVKGQGKKTELEDAVAIIFLLLVTISGFMLEGIRMGVFDPYSFLGSVFGKIMFQSFDYNTFWLIHTLISSAFIAYIPYGKLIHLFATPITSAWTAYREEKEYGGVS